MNITVFATADHTKNVTTPVTVSSFANALKGTYVLQVSGVDAGQFAYQTTGALIFDGNGNITSGEETINNFSSGFFSGVYKVQGQTAPSTYFIGPDGRGSITLTVGSNLTTTTQTFAFVVISNSEALLSELDGNSARGTLELQDSSAASTMPSGAYAFVTSGSDAGSPNGPGFGAPVPAAFGGVLNIDNNPSLGSISGQGSLADEDYFNTAMTRRTLQSCVPPAGLTGTVSQPDSFGLITITLTGTTCFGVTQPATIQFTGYIVDATHIRLIESDDVNGSGGYLTAGIAVGQGSAASTFTNASLSGPYVFGILGYDINDFSSGITGFSFTSAGVLNADGIGNLTGIGDTFYPGDSAAFTADPTTGTYSMDAELIGRAQLAPILKGSPKPHPTLLFYLTGDGTAPLALWSNSSDLNFPAVGVGIAYPQAANPSSLFLNAKAYGVGFTRNPGGEVDGTGSMAANVVGSTGTVTGTVDDTTNNNFNGTGTVPLSDTFSLPADSFGRIGGTFLNVPGSLGPYVEYYMVDNSHGFLIETDLLNFGVSSPAVNLGYFSLACDVTNPASCGTAATHFSTKHVLARNKVRSSRKVPFF